jgi:hypothetical protein
MHKFLLALLPVLVLSACGGDSHHPLAGNWSQDTGSDAKGMSLEFDTGGSKVIVHTAPRADGSHDHPKASYTFDAATKALVVKGELQGAGKPDSWAGTLGAGQFELKAGDVVLRFRSGGKPAGH